MNSNAPHGANAARFTPAGHKPGQMQSGAKLTEKGWYTKMKKWYNFETSFMPAADALSVFLKRKGIYYERSGAYGNYHFEILTDENGVISINSFLYDDTMLEG